jgi:hypothetical protein
MSYLVSAETLLEDVYNAAQNVDEKVVIWGCRLESMSTRIVEKGLTANTNMMMRTRYSGTGFGTF